MRSGGSHLPLRARRNVPAGRHRRTTALSTNFGRRSAPAYPRLSPGCGRHVDGTRCNAHATSEAMRRRRRFRLEVGVVARFLARLVALNDGWARPFGEFNHRWTRALFRAIDADPRPAARVAGWVTLHSRGDHGHPDRHAARLGGPRHHRPADGRGRHARRDDPLHGARGRGRGPRRLQRDGGRRR